MRGVLLSLVALGVAIGAHAEERSSSYTFENDFGGRVTCTVHSGGGQVRHSIATAYSSSLDQINAASPATWASSGCAAFVNAQTRTVSQQNLADRVRHQNEDFGPLDYDRDIAPRIQRLICMSADHTNDPKCK